MTAEGSERLAPGFRLRIDGADLPAVAASDVVEVGVHQDVDAPGMFILRLLNWDTEKAKVTWADEDLFAVGSEVEVLMGYAGRLDAVMVGEVTGLEPEFGAEEAPMLTVRGYDRRHRLMRGRKTRSLAQVKDSDVARQIANGAGLTPEVEDTGVVHPYLLQHNQTDLEFLSERAARIGFEVAMEGKVLRFRSRPIAESPALTLARDEDLLEFHPRLSSLSQVGKVAVRGWDPLGKEAWVGEAAAGEEGSRMGGSTTGPAEVDQAFGASVAASIDRPVQSQEEADRLAQGRLKETALAYVSGEGVAIGRTDLKAGTMVRIEGVGRRFSGLYYAVATCHSYTPRRGYRTAFTFRRNALS